LAEDFDEKMTVLRQSGIAGMQEVIQLMDKEARIAKWNDKNVIDPEQKAKANRTFWDIAEQNPKGFWNNAKVDISGIPDTWSKMGFTYPDDEPEYRPGYMRGGR